jgi:chorismate--pyruvate lyase
VKHIPHDPHWCRAPVGAGACHPWLTDTGSLTARLQAHAGKISVRVVFQGLRHANPDEHFLFGRQSAWVHVREVLLMHGRTPLVFAHTVVAPANLRGRWRSVLGLGNRPLGAALFADHRIRRYALHQKKLPAAHPLHACAAVHISKLPPALWARRSIFASGDSPILVSEVFYPAVLRL